MEIAGINVYILCIQSSRGKLYLPLGRKQSKISFSESPVPQEVHTIFILPEKLATTWF